MDINSISFGKLIPSKKQEIKKNDNMTPAIENNAGEAKTDKTILQKIRDARAAYALTGLMAAGTLASCVEQNANLTVDTKGVEALLNQLMTLQQESMKLQQQMIELIKQNNSDNKEIIALTQQLIEQNTQIMSILTGLRSDMENFEENVMEAMYKIIALAEKSNANDAEFLAKLDAIIAGQGTNSEKLQQILEANNEQNKLLLNIAALISSVGDELSQKLTDIYNEFKNSNQSDNDYNEAHSKMLEKIFQEILNSNELSKEQIEQIKKVQEQMENNQIKESEALDKITDILGSIDSKLDALKDAIENLGTGNEALAAILKDFYNDWKSGNITTNALLAKIMEAIDKGNIKDAEILGELQKIREEVANGNKTVEQGIADVKDILNKIQANTDAIKNTVITISSQIDKLGTQLDNNHKETVDILKNINNGVGSIDKKMDQVIKNQDKANQTLVEISGKIDEANSQLSQINDKTITIEQMRELLGPMFEEVYNRLQNISGNQISIEDIKNAMAEYKTDLTKTNALIETLTNVVQNLNLTADMKAELQAIAGILTDIKTQGGSASASIIASLTEALQKLANIEKNGADQLEILKALQETAKLIQANQEAFMEQANAFGIKLFEELAKISAGTGDITKLLAYAENYKDALVQAEQTRQEQKAILQAILENQGKGDSGITIEELQQIIPNYTDVLNEIKEKLGNVITSSDLENFYLKTQPDLTKTNALIETLTNVVQNKNFNVSGGSADMTKVESLIGQILDSLNAQKNPTQEQIQAILDAVNQVIKNTTASQTPETRAFIAQAKGLASDAIAKYNAYQQERFEQTGKKGNYQFDPYSIKIDEDGKAYLDPAYIYTKMA